MKRFCISIFTLVFFLFLPGIVISQVPMKNSARIPDISPVNIKEGINAPLVPDSGQILFQVDLSQWAAKGRFNPATDSVDMPGTFNNWAGSATLQKVGTTLVYQIALSLDSLTVQAFRFRINRDTNNMEFPNGGNRMFRVPGHSMIVNYMYNEFDTTTVPMIFKCHMYYQIIAHHFDPRPLKDYLDMAGSMNNWGDYDVLFDINHDSTYQLTLNIPRSLISPVIPLDFKFRINGNWNTSEFLNGDPLRSYFLHDTTGGFQNLVDVWYDDENPGILTPPWAYDLYIQGEYFVGQTLTGSYIYEDVNSKPEGNSIYKWYRADSLTQVNPELISSSDSSINYVLDTIADLHKYIAFEVTPVAQGTGDSLIGKPVRTWTGLIGGVGIGELSGIKPGIYPNPVISRITFTNMENIQQIEIFSVLGQRAGVIETRTPGKITYDVSGLGRGIYFVKFSKPDHTFTTVKFIKN